MLIKVHFLSAVQDAKRIIVLEGKQMAEEGTHTSLLQKNGAYAKLYRAAQVTAEG